MGRRRRVTLLTRTQFYMNVWRHGFIGLKAKMEELEQEKAELENQKKELEQQKEKLEQRVVLLQSENENLLVKLKGEK